MSWELYQAFCTKVLGMSSKSWASRTKAAFKNLILHNINTMMYYFETDYYNLSQELFSYQEKHTNLARVLACLTLLLVDANAFTPCIINWVWGDDK
jgi:hypothetical protein